MKNSIILICLFVAGAFSLQAQFHYGAGTQYNIDASALGFQGKLFYEYDEAYRGSGTFTYHLDNALNWSIDLDGHYKLFQIFQNLNFAPMAGLAIISFTGDTQLGLNVGAFLDKEINDRFYYLEPKLTFNNGSAFIVSVGTFF